MKNLKKGDIVKIIPNDKHSEDVKKHYNMFRRIQDVIQADQSLYKVGSIKDYALESDLEKQKIFTDAFYSDPELTLNILNKIVQNNHVADMDMYQSGTFLFMEAFDNDTVKEILAEVISDVELYKTYNNESFVSDDATEIGLCALQDEHSYVFKSDFEIKWDAEVKEFVFAKDYQSY